MTLIVVRHAIDKPAGIVLTLNASLYTFIGCDVRVFVGACHKLTLVARELFCAVENFHGQLVPVNNIFDEIFI